MRKLIGIVLLFVSSISYSQTETKDLFTATVGVEAYIPGKVLRTMQVGGVSESFQLEYRPLSNTAYIFNTGFYYRLPTEDTKSVTLLPVLAGVKVYLDSNVSLIGAAGFAYTSGRGGLQPMYSSGLSVNLGRFNIELKYVITVPRDTFYQLNGATARFGYRFN